MLLTHILKRIRDTLTLHLINFVHSFLLILHFCLLIPQLLCKFLHFFCKSFTLSVNFKLFSLKYAILTEI